MHDLQRQVVWNWRTRLVFEHQLVGINASLSQKIIDIQLLILPPTSGNENRQYPCILYLQFRKMPLRKKTNKLNTENFGWASTLTV